MAADATPAQPTLAQSVLRTKIVNREVTGTIAPKAPSDGALDVGIGDERVKAGQGDPLILLRCSGGKGDVSNTSLKERGHAGACCPCVLGDRDRIASLEQDNRAATVDVREKQLLIVEE